MTPEELLKAENAFIRLHNQGVSLEDIARRLRVEVSLIEGWKKDFENILVNTNDQFQKGVTTEVLGKKFDEGYFGRSKYDYATHHIEDIRGTIYRIANRNEEDMANDI